MNFEYPFNFNIVAGMSRGGTNLVWTSLASPRYHFITKLEINQLLSAKQIGILSKYRLELFTLINWYCQKLGNIPAIKSNNLAIKKDYLKIIIDKSLCKWISLGQQIDIGSENSYTIKDASSAQTVNLKMVSSWYHSPIYGLLQRNNPLKYLELLNSLLDPNKIVFVLRHPFAQAEAWMRRGCSEEMALRMYLFYANYYLKQKKHDVNNKIILCPLQSFLNDPSELICKVHNLDTLHAFRVAKQSSINNSQYRNTSNKISKLIPLQNFHEMVNPNIDDLHIKNFRGSKNSSQSLKALALYKLILDNYSR